MAVINELLKIVARVRLVWGDSAIEMGRPGSDWVYRITCPDKYRVQLHGTPSDRNWEKSVWDDLNKHGFASDEAVYLEKCEAERQERIREDQLENERAFKATQARARAAQRAGGALVAQPAPWDWVLGKHQFPETRRLLVEPDLAQEILEKHNGYNRKLRPARVEYWNGIVSRGEWVFTHQGIAIDTEAQFLDGQHRMAMSVASKFTLDTLVTVGLPASVRTKIDVGANRSGADAVYMSGKREFTNTYSGAARLIALYQRYGSELLLGTKSRISNDDLTNYIIKYGTELDNAVVQAHTFRKLHSCPPVSAIPFAAFLYVIFKMDPNDVFRTIFIHGFVSREGLNVGDVRIALQSYMESMKGDLRRSSVTTQFAVLIKAWNKFVTGEGAKSLSFSADKDKKFPKANRID